MRGLMTITTLLACTGGPVFAQSTGPATRVMVFPLRNASAADVGHALRQALGDRDDVRVVAEPASGSLFVTAPPDDLERVTALLKQLDRAPQAVAVDLAIVELHEVASVDRNLKGTLSEWIAKTKEQGVVKSVERASLTTLENQQAQIQLGTSKSVPSGQTTGFGRGRAGVRTIQQYRSREFGTQVALRPRMAGDRVLLEISVERSWLGDAPQPESDDADAAFVPPETKSLTLQSTVRLAPGKTTLVGSKTSGNRLHAVLANVTLVEAGDGER